MIDSGLSPTHQYYPQVETSSYVNNRHSPHSYVNNRHSPHSRPSSLMRRLA